MPTVNGLLSNTPLMPGGIVNTEPHKSHTCFFAAADIDPALGGIPFGRAVTYKVASLGLAPYDRLQVTLPAVALKFLGVAQQTDSVVGILNNNPRDYESPRGYLPGELAVVYSGLVAVEVLTAITPASPVFYEIAPGVDHGKFRADAGTNAAVQVTTGAAWRGSAAAGGVCALYLNLTL